MAYKPIPGGKSSNPSNKKTAVGKKPPTPIKPIVKPRPIKKGRG